MRGGVLEQTPCWGTGEVVEAVAPQRSAAEKYRRREPVLDLTTISERRCSRARIWDASSCWSEPFGNTHTLADLQISEGEIFDMQNLALGSPGLDDLNSLFNDAWTEFTATAPVDIDLVAQASLREMMADRIMRAAHNGEVDRTALKALALRGL
jgi:hypothetical protein